ncbi:MAG: lysophospholipid acyltransferase family protein [Candidatus Methylacidiphilales bacterium]|nr:lysophospholipid acyltransferase family protein [Candidatus Methylacidiphilales bacterium]
MEDPRPQVPLIDLLRSLPWLARVPGVRLLVRGIEALLGFRELNAIYAGVRRRCLEEGKDFFRACMEETGLSRRVDNADLLKIPESGPVVVVANHPLGGLDAIALADLVISLRPDTKVMANYLLARMPESQARLIPVDPFDGADAGRRNIGSMKQALRWLNQGGLLLVFPAGEVSHLHARTMTVTDPAWNPHAAQLILRTRAAVVPVFVAGRNSWVFQILGLIHPRLRTLLLVRELVRARRSTVRIHVGNALPASQFDHMASAGEMTDYLRLQTYVLQGRGDHWQKPDSVPLVPLQPLAPAEDPGVLAAEILSLSEDRLLARHQEWEVHYSRGAELPAVLREIGRLREMTFREVGEGTGLAADLESYDEDYVHLFLWDRSARSLIGAYRIGESDRILKKKGVRGLYTRSLFHFRPAFVQAIGPALELGRSFIRPEYQKKYHSLNLLWRGIGGFLLRFPRYHTLFGPVSISRDYHEISRNLLVQFLRNRKQDRLRKRMTRAQHPPRPPWVPGLGLDAAGARMQTIEDVSALISEIENDGKGVPVLLRHYLKLNARLINFNVDPAFSDALDGLVVVDLRESEPKLLQRFMGKDGLESFAHYHRRNGTEDLSPLIGEFP